MGFPTQHLHVLHLGTALKDLLLEQAIKEKIKFKKHVLLKRLLHFLLAIFCYPGPLFPEPRHEKGSPRLRSHFKMLLFISVVVHWVNEFNVTTEIEWLFNRPLVIIYAGKE